MKIAVIGGGASGITTAYLLDRNGHDVALFEKESMLGGNIRTLGKNVVDGGTDPALRLEAGVIEFSANFSNFLNLMHELDIQLERIEVGSALFPRDKRPILSPHVIRSNLSGWKRVQETIRFLGLKIATLGRQPNLLLSSEPELSGQTLAGFLKHGRLGDQWLKLLIMYSYSMRFDQVGDFPADLAIHVLRNYMTAGWFRLPGGVFSYIERILERFHGDIHLDTHIQGIERHPGGIRIMLENTTEDFDKVVIATPPDQVLSLLTKPTSEESVRFRAWRANYAQTVIHTDASLYDAFHIRHPSEFDFFQTSTGWGYNAYLNRLSGLATDTSYYLAFDLNELIDSSKILYRQKHHTPAYTTEALKYRSEVLRSNGENHTYHVGAYLADGLHEGAISTAMQVAQRIGQ